MRVNYLNTDQSKETRDRRDVSRETSTRKDIAGQDTKQFSRRNAQTIKQVKKCHGVESSHSRTSHSLSCCCYCEVVLFKKGVEQSIKIQ